MTPEIWQDIAMRLRNVRADMIGQWQGDIDNRDIEQSINMLGNTIQAWRGAKPSKAPPASPL